MPVTVMCTEINLGWKGLRARKHTTLLTPYEQYFIQTLHQEEQLIPEQFAGEQNPFFQLAIDPAYHRSSSI